MTTSIPKPEHGSLAWLRVRHRDENNRVRFGASEAPLLMGTSTYGDIGTLFMSKMTEPEVKEANAAMMRGTLLEPALIQYAQTLLQVRVSTPEMMFVNGRLIATLDGLTEDNHTIVEAKTTTVYSSDDTLPDDYLWQGVAQLACVSEARRVFFVVLDKYQRLGHWELWREEAEPLITELLLQAETIGEYFDDGKLPPWFQQTEQIVKALYPFSEGTVELGSAGSAAVEEYRAAKQAKELAEEMEQSARDRLVALLGQYEIGTVDGHKVVSYKTRKGSSRLDTKRLGQEHPELVAQYTTTSAPTRTLRLV